MGVSARSSDVATYERARRLANLAMWTVDMQRRRLNSEEPEDKDFVLRRWSDFHFFIVALTRLRRAAVLAAKIPLIKGRMQAAVAAFDTALPNLKMMRDVAEHIDDYSIDAGRDKAVNREGLEVGGNNGETWNWLGFSIDLSRAMLASNELFLAIKKSRTEIQ